MPYHSRGSICEAKNQLVYGHRVGYFTKEEYSTHLASADAIHQEINALIAGLRRRL
jgi:hypothetical protein